MRNHNEVRIQIETDQRKTGSHDILESLWSPKTQRVHAWMALIIDGMLPFSFCENERARQFLKFDSIARNTLVKYMGKLTEIVEKKLAAHLPEKFALVFDGWSASDSHHFVALFATFPEKNEVGYSKVLLTISPLGDGTSYTSQDHYDFITYSLSVYGKTWDNIVCLIGDNCNTNKALATQARRPLVGCASHRFNLAVKDQLKDYADILSNINTLMKKLKNLIPAAKLRKHTLLQPKCSNATRWSSTFEMLKRYKEIQQYLPLLNIQEIDNLTPSQRDVHTLDHLLTVMIDLDSVTKALQGDGVTMFDVRTLFDEVMVLYNGTSERLGLDASIIHDKVFKNAILKIQKGEENTLTTEETIKVSTLRTTQKKGEAINAVISLDSLAERALKKRKVFSVESSLYGDTRFIVPTSNMCERLFSEAGYGRNSRRLRLLDTHFESQLFLRSNKRFWDLKEIHEILKGEKEDVSLTVEK